MLEAHVSLSLAIPELHSVPGPELQPSARKSAQIIAGTKIVTHSRNMPDLPPALPLRTYPGVISSLPILADESTLQPNPTSRRLPATSGAATITNLAMNRGSLARAFTHSGDARP